MVPFKKGIMAGKALKAGGAVALAAYITSLVPFFDQDAYIWIPILTAALRGINNALKHKLGFDLFRLIKKS